MTSDGWRDCARPRRRLALRAGRNGELMTAAERPSALAGQGERLPTGPPSRSRRGILQRICILQQNSGPSRKGESFQSGHYIDWSEDVSDDERHIRGVARGEKTRLAGNAGTEHGCRRWNDRDRLMFAGLGRRTPRGHEQLPTGLEARMSAFDCDHPKQWRDRADEMVALADQAKDKLVRYSLLGLAAGFSSIAQVAEQRPPGGGEDQTPPRTEG